MALSSPTFLVFLALAAAIYYLLPRRFRAPFLLLASAVFYMWKLPAYGAVVLGTAVFGYFAALGIDRAAETKLRKTRLAVSVCVLLALLIVFKYFNFFSETLSALFGAGQTPLLLSLAQPVGIAYYTLQLIGYFVDVYRRDIAAEREIVPYALFVTFFPQMLAGPINRAGEMLPQFKNPKTYDYANIAAGGQRFLVGFFKKIVMADGLALMVEGVWADLGAAAGWPMLFAVILYVVQLYCDFSGYTDMALGAARMLGFEMRENFNSPLLACGVGDFWSRWHMSLTDWLRDYVYFPLGGSRKGFARKLLNVCIVFIISGLWHGAGLTYLIWGLWNALFRAADELLSAKFGESFSKPKGALKALRIIATNIIFALGLLIFRSPDVESIGAALANLARYGSLSEGLAMLRAFAAKGIFTDSYYFYIYTLCIALGFALMVALDVIRYRADLRGVRIVNPLGELPKKLRWLIYWFAGFSAAAFYLISLTGQASSSMFIYSGF